MLEGDVSAPRILAHDTVPDIICPCSATCLLVPAECFTMSLAKVLIFNHPPPRQVLEKVEQFESTLPDLGAGGGFSRVTYNPWHCDLSSWNLQQ